MQNRLDFSLTSAQQQELEHERVHNAVTEVRVRCQALLRLSEGKGASVVAAENDVVRRTVYGWHWRYREGGLAALQDKPRSGRPRKWTQAYLDTLQVTLVTDPKALGYDFTLWTLERLSAHLAKVTNIELTSRSLEDLLQKDGYRYRRPKYGLQHLQDADAVKRAHTNLAELKKAQSDPTTRQESTSYSLWTKLP